MPVDVLLCEGVAGSPDARILRKLFGGICSIEPSGSKHGMDTQVLAWRAATPGSVVACLRDADLDSEWPRDRDRPQPWVKKTAGGQSVNFGWLWSRTEIENYVIDPNVVAVALGFDAPTQAQCQEILARAAERVSAYTAARVALSMSRISFKSLLSQWDRRRIPRSLEKSSYRKHLKRLVRQCSQGVAPTEKQVVGRFKDLLREFGENGLRRSDYLHTYSGKDLLIEMSAELPTIGFADFGGLREAILLAIERADQNDVIQWVPEWAELRRQMLGFIA
jgi:hypothetical protein